LIEMSDLRWTRIYIYLALSMAKHTSSFVLPSSHSSTHRKYILQPSNSGPKIRTLSKYDTDGRISITSLDEKDEKETAVGSEKDKDVVWNTSLFPAKDFTVLQGPYPKKKFQTQIYFQTLAALIGVFSGISVAEFKLSIEEVRQLTYGGELAKDLYFMGVIPYFLVPVIGGCLVSLLSLSGDFSPGLRGAVNEVDEYSLSYDSARALGNEDICSTNLGTFRPLRKALAAIATLGTGNSLGPEGPGVEIGIVASRLTMNMWPPDLLDSNAIPSDNSGDEVEIDEDKIAERISRNRLLLACGAAAGVSSGFNSPVSGVFFALEVVQANLPNRLSIPSPPTGTQGISSDDIVSKVEIQQQSLVSNSGSINAILISSVLAALVARIFLGDELALQVITYEIETPLAELPIYLFLGLICGCVSVVFSQTAKISRSLLGGKVGPQPVKDAFGSIPLPLLPIVGGFICGGVGYFYPQVLFFGYETLNSLLENTNLSTELLLSLLFAKIFTTAISAGSGLVGGTLAPSLFLGGVTGAAFHNVLCSLFLNFNIPQAIPNADSTQVLFNLAGVPVYSIIGAASVLASLFDAPLTASLLLFEETRNYDILLPLLASTGIATLSSDIIENKIENR